MLFNNRFWRNEKWGNKNKNIWIIEKYYHVKKKKKKSECISGFSYVIL